MEILKSLSYKREFIPFKSVLPSFYDNFYLTIRIPYQLKGKYICVKNYLK